MVAGLMFGFASKSKSPSHLSRGKSCRFDPADGGAPVPVVALGQQQLGQEALVGELFLPGDGEGFVQDRPDRWAAAAGGRPGRRPRPRPVRSGRAAGAGSG